METFAVGAKTHTDRQYEEQLRRLRESLLRMAGQVEEMIALSVKALVERDVDLARNTIEADSRVNQSEIDADELCLLILAKRQPMASDLRFITLSLKMVTDLERIGDLAVNICERALDLDDASPPRPWKDVLRMSTIVRSMVHDAIDAFIESDENKALEVISRDDEVDSLYVHVFRDLLQLMQDDSETVERAIHVQSVAKWLERMGDHSTNLAEQVIFFVRGKDIRHEGRRG